MSPITIKFSCKAAIFSYIETTEDHQIWGPDFSNQIACAFAGKEFFDLGIEHTINRVIKIKVRLDDQSSAMKKANLLL